MNGPNSILVLVQRFEEAVWCAAGINSGTPLPFDPDACPAEQGGFAAVLHEQSDETLVLAVRASYYGREAFVELFVNRYTGRLVHWCGAWGDHHAAEDLAQEVVMKMLRGDLSSYNVLGGEFRKYVKTVARNLAISRGRKKSERPIGDEFPELGATPPDDPVETGDDLRRMNELITRLPPRLRGVVQLKMDGIETAEIARRLGLTPQQAHKAYHAALAELRNGFRETG